MGRSLKRKKSKRSRIAYSAEYVRETQRRAVQEILEEQGFNVSGLLAAAANAHGWAAQFAAHFAAADTRGLACGRGCSWCCHLAVAAFPHEIFLMAEWLRRNVPEEVVGILERAHAVAEEIRGLFYHERALRVIPCPLLEKNCCLAYGARPVACIGWHSFDARLCETYVKGDQDMAAEQIPEIRESGFVIAETTAETLASHGAASQREVEIVRGLPIALEASVRLSNGLLESKCSPCLFDCPKTCKEKRGAPAT